MEFFTKLESLREDIFRDDDEEKPTILEVYHELLDLCGYLNESISDNNYELENLAKISKTIFNYESIISKDDVRGLFFFLTNVIEGYSSFNDGIDGVQLITVHKAKGLEFPVTIVSSLSKDKFPLSPKDPERKKDNINKKDIFYTLNMCLGYKYYSEDEEIKLELAEENRVIYVAMTRAQVFQHL